VKTISKLDIVRDADLKRIEAEEKSEKAALSTSTPAATTTSPATTPTPQKK
jgi:hypothetical protein